MSRPHIPWSHRCSHRVKHKASMQLSLNQLTLASLPTQALAALQNHLTHVFFLKLLPLSPVRVTLFSSGVPLTAWSLGYSSIKYTLPYLLVLITPNDYQISSLRTERPCLLLPSVSAPCLAFRNVFGNMLTFKDNIVLTTTDEAISQLEHYLLPVSPFFSSISIY